jgi:hypothetical protein
VPRESLDAPENLPKEAPRQVAFSELQAEIPGMSDEPRAALEEPLLETREGPALDGRDGRLLVERDHAALVARKARALLDYLDFRPVEERCAAGVLRAAAARGR